MKALPGILSKSVILRARPGLEALLELVPVQARVRRLEAGRKYFSSEENLIGPDFLRFVVFLELVPVDNFIADVERTAGLLL